MTFEPMFLRVCLLFCVLTKLTLQKKNNTSMPTSALPTVISCKVASLRPRGYHTFEEWAAHPGHIYIGRDMSRYVAGAVGSKWGNPYMQGSGMTLEERIEAYEAMIRGTPSLMQDLRELQGATELGCWCAPGPCHGNVLVRLLAERHDLVESRTPLTTESSEVSQPEPARRTTTPGPTEPTPKQMKKKHRLQ